MATRASIGARRAIASQSIEQSIESIAAGLKLDVPEQPSPQVNRDPELRTAAHHERIASFLAVVASKVGKPVKESAEPQGPADGASVPPLAENEPPHTQTVTPLASTTVNAPAEDEGEGDQPEGADEPHFAGKPLSAYDSVDDGALTDQDGVGEATAKKIIRARKRRDAKK
jgi:hypothetical protein